MMGKAQKLSSYVVLNELKDMKAEIRTECPNTVHMWSWQLDVLNFPSSSI